MTQRFLTILAISLLTLSACSTDSPSVTTMLINGGQISDTFELFAVTDTCMIEQKPKLYIDLMKEQEETLEYKYRVSSLYGPEDFGHDLLESADGVTYAPEDTGGVDVCQLLSSNDYEQYCPNVPIKITWNEKIEGLIRYWRKTDIRFVPYSSGGANFETFQNWSVMVWDYKEIPAFGTSVELFNLYRNENYEYQIIVNNRVSKVGEFNTADYPRAIEMAGVRNVRDIGGYQTSYGKRTKQGLIYRGSEIMKTTVGQRTANYTDKIQIVQDRDLEIGHEIDLKSANNTENTGISNLSPAKYSNLEVSAYEGFVNGTTSSENICQIFEILANSDKEHSYIHCQDGADQTAMVAFFLNAILGVSYTDLIIDYELTTATNNKHCHMHNAKNAHLPKLLNSFTNLPYYDYGATLNQNAVEFLTRQGVSMDTIEKIRSIMIEDYSPHLVENEDI